MNAFKIFWSKIFIQINPLLAGVSSVASYLLFPEEGFKIWCHVIWFAALLDLLTKCFAIFSNSIRKEKSFRKGIYMAFKSKAFSSEIFYKKMIVKLLSYLVIQILVNLSLYIDALGTMNMAIASVIYGFIFLREFASNIENLIEAGADGLEPLLYWIRKKAENPLDDKCSCEKPKESDQKEKNDEKQD